MIAISDASRTSPGTIRLPDGPPPRSDWKREEPGRGRTATPSSAGGHNVRPRIYLRLGPRNPRWATVAADVPAAAGDDARTSNAQHRTSKSRSAHEFDVGRSTFSVRRSAGTIRFSGAISGSPTRAERWPGRSAHGQVHVQRQTSAWARAGLLRRSSRFGYEGWKRPPHLGCGNRDLPDRLLPAEPQNRRTPNRRTSKEGRGRADLILRDSEFGVR